MKRALLFLLISWALAAPAQASYAQMRLDGIGLLLALALVVAYGLAVDLALVTRLFRYRTAAVIVSIGALTVVYFLLGQTASPTERFGFFKGSPGGAGLVVLVVTSAVFVPFILIAPFAQHLSLRHGRRWPVWITAWMAVQLALPPLFLVLTVTERYFWQQEYAAGQAVGRAVSAGGLDMILERAEQRRERIWGTGWTSPWQPKVPGGDQRWGSGWPAGLANTLDASALMGTNEPLSSPDRAALLYLMERHSVGYGMPHVQAKLIWDALEPGRFAQQLAPAGVNEMGTVPEEVLPVLLELLEKYGEERLCPGGRMVDADRAVLQALVEAKGRVWNVDTRAHEMRREWVAFPGRIERLCR